MPLYFDWTMILLLPAIALATYAQIKVSSTYKKYSQVRCRSGWTASDLARRLLDENDLSDVRVERVRGHLSDHYSPRERVLRLSESSFNSSSVAALGVAAHECGHAIQHADGYFPLSFRNLLAPVANIGSQASWLLIVGGVVLSWANLISWGILLFSLAVVFQLVTLPVEFNASRRALAALEGGGYLTEQELNQSGQVLRAAALTYVAAALTAVLQLLRLLLIFGRNRD